MSLDNPDVTKRPVPDTAEDNAYFPSAYSLSQYTSSKTDLADDHYENPYRGKLKILMVATDERYMLMQNGTMFSSGNHPVETLLPMHHLVQAGFEFDIATVSGNPAKLELWAMPSEDEAIQSLYKKYLPKLKKPLKLADVLANSLGDDSPYLAVFFPGGHGAMNGIPHSQEVKELLLWAMKNDKYVISLCHGPAALLAAGIDESKESYVFNGYKMCVFPDTLDKFNPSIGYMPGEMPWFLGEKLQALGVEILNEGISGACHQDRNVLTGDSPLASNELGKMAAKALLTAVGQG